MYCSIIGQLSRFYVREPNRLVNVPPPEGFFKAKLADKFITLRLNVGVKPVSDVTSIDLAYLGSLVNTDTFDENTVDAAIWASAPDGMYCPFLIIVVINILNDYCNYCINIICMMDRR